LGRETWFSKGGEGKMIKIIQIDRSVVPACDISLDEFETIVSETADIEKVGGYKIGPALTGRPGYDKVVEVARRYTEKPLIFDAQKWGTDIPDTAHKILDPLKESGVNAVILFPQSGPATGYAWIRVAQDLDLGVIVGGHMTHPRYMEGDYSEGKDVNYSNIFLEELGMSKDVSGFLRAEAPEIIYRMAAKMGVTNFVVPGNKPDRIKHYKGIIESCGVDNASYWSPGLVAQGGEISEGAKAAGERFHAIVGRGIYQAEDKRQAALELTSKL
jgi:orotidine-5'-phosphate decarboxylase